MKTKQDQHKKPSFRTIIIRSGGGVLYEGATCGLPVKESAILAKSMEYFRDPEPCMIHRSAVLARVFCEFEKWMDDTGATGTIEFDLDDLPEELHSILDLRHPNGKN